jgi:transposase
MSTARTNTADIRNAIQQLIPRKCSQKYGGPHDAASHRKRNGVERGFGWLMHLRAVATRLS